MGVDTTGIDFTLLWNGGSKLIRESLPARGGTLTDLGASTLTTQVMLSVGVPVCAGDIISTVSFVSGATAAGTPTNWWFALYDDLLALQQQTADQTSTAWAANTPMPVALAAPVTIKRTGIAYAAIMVKATSTPSLIGVSTFHLNLSNGLVTGQKVLVQSSGSALTATAPATIATPTTTALRPYCTLS